MDTEKIEQSISPKVTGTTDEILNTLAFDNVWKKRWLDAGYTNDYRHVVRHRLKKGVNMSSELKDTILTKLGCTVVQEALCVLPKKPKKVSTPRKPSKKPQRAKD